MRRARKTIVSVTFHGHYVEDMTPIITPVEERKRWGIIARWGGFSKDLPLNRKGGVILQRWGANAKVGSNRKEGGGKTQR